MHAGRAAPARVERVRPDRLGDDEHPLLGPPESDLLPATGALDLDDLELGARQRGRSDEVRHAEPARRSQRSRGCGGRGAAAPRPARRASERARSPAASRPGRRARRARRARARARCASPARRRSTRTPPHPARRRSRPSRASVLATSSDRLHAASYAPKGARGPPGVRLALRMSRVCADFVSDACRRVVAPRRDGSRSGQRLDRLREREPAGEEGAADHRSFAAETRERRGDRPRSRYRPRRAPASLRPRPRRATRRRGLRASRRGSCSSRGVASLPAEAQRRASSTGSSSEVSVQPSTATRPSRASTATTRRSPARPNASRRKVGETAAVPTITRSAPASSAAATAATER